MDCDDELEMIQDKRRQAPRLGQWEIWENAGLMNTLAKVIKEDDPPPHAENENETDTDSSDGPSYFLSDAERARRKLDAEYVDSMYKPVMKRLFMSRINDMEKAQEAEAQGTPRPKYKDPAAEDYKRFLKYKEMEAKNKEKMNTNLKSSKKELAVKHDYTPHPVEAQTAHSKSLTSAIAVVRLLPFIHDDVPKTFWEETRHTYNRIVSGTYKPSQHQMEDEDAVEVEVEEPQPVDQGQDQNQGT